MPICGSQVILCDLPVRFDTYSGCTHGCEYCFVSRCGKNSPLAVTLGESVKALAGWIEGKRTGETNWCDWPIPLHWGGISDPFQPGEKQTGRSLACLELFAETGYPVVISTKGSLIATPEYLDRLARCNAVVQLSLVGPTLARHEPGAPSFPRRLAMLEAVARASRRVIVRVQPYAPAYKSEVIAAIPAYRAAGVYGMTVEGLKAFARTPGMVKLGTDWVYPQAVLERDFRAIRAACAASGLAFYAAENRLRALGCNSCCCGVDGLPGFEPNTANLNHIGPGGIRYRPGMLDAGTGRAFAASVQSTAGRHQVEALSYRACMEAARHTRAIRESLSLDGPALSA